MQVRVSYCDFPLPEMMPMANKTDSCAQRVFIVAQPHSFSDNILRDMLCRFGGLIDCYFMSGKSATGCGFVC